MKKFISMVMAAAMVVSLVPATAFAAESTLKVVDAKEWTEQFADQEKEAKRDLVIDTAQLQIKVKDVDTKMNVVDDFEIKLNFNKAEFKADKTDNSAEQFEVSVYDQDTNKKYPLEATYSYEEDDTKVTIEFSEYVIEAKADDKVDTPEAQAEDEDVAEDEIIDIDENDVIYINILAADLALTSYKVGTEATVKVTGDLGTTDEKVIASIEEIGLEVEIDDLTDMAEDETVTLEEEITIEPAVGDVIGDCVGAGEEITLKISKGFEFTGEGKLVYGTIERDLEDIAEIEDDEITIVLTDGMAAKAKLTIVGLGIDSCDAKAGDVATITVKGDDCDAVAIEVATVVAEGLKISVDEDEDLPEMWAGVDAENTGLTVNDSHEALEVTFEELIGGSYNDRDEVEFVLPEGVYVTNVTGTLAGLMKEAYEEGDYESFVIKKGKIEETEVNAPFEYDFTLELIADATFVGDVELTALVDGEEIGAVKIATFKAPFAVEAAQNDLKIDYRNTEVPTDVVIKEAEAGLWEEGLVFTLALDKYIEFEGDPVVTVNEDDSDMEVDADEKGGVIEIVIDKESDDEAGVITVSGMELYMERNLPAGAYDLEMTSNASYFFYTSELFTTEASELEFYTVEKVEATLDGGEKIEVEVKELEELVYTVADVKGYVAKDGGLDVPAMVVKEGFVNIVTAGREQDDASFTTKVVVPVGESYMVAGEQTIALEVPAYVTDAGRTMLPVRAVATALGINNNNVLWDQATKTVTILYGQRIITMQVGSSVINVNGSAIPASAAVEVVNGRTFLGFRDLATALGVTDITWDQATRTVTLNGNI